MTGQWSENLSPLADEDYRQSVWDRVRRRVTVSESGCWEWQGARVPDGYGQVRVGRRMVSVHRVALAISRGSGWALELQVDHLCRNRACCNPDHLELVTTGENTRRGISGDVNGGRQRVKTHCPQGHSYETDGYRHPVTGYRHCKPCRAASERRRSARAREALAYARWSA